VDTTNEVLITVINFNPGSISEDQTICEGETPGELLSVDPSGDGTFTYQWQESSNGITFTDIAGAEDPTYTPPSLTQDTWYKREVTSTLNLKECILETNMVRVTVINFSPGSIGSDQTICSGSAPAMFTSVAASGDGSFAYQWQDSPDGSTFTNIDGANMATYSAPALTSDTWYRRVVTATVNGVPCTAETNIIKVTVNNLLPGTVYDDQTICEGVVPNAFTSDAALAGKPRRLQLQ